MRIGLVVWPCLIGVALALAPGCSRTEPTDAEGQARDDSADESPPVAARRKSAEKSLIELDPHPRVVFETSLGSIVLELDRAAAPKTVRHFLALVEGGRYHGTIFHRVDQDYVIMGGVYDESGRPSHADRTIPSEAKNGLKNRRGTVAMSRDSADIDSATCEFFINLDDNENLDHHGDSPEEYGYCVFGKVVDMEIVDKLQRVEVSETAAYGKSPVEKIVLRSARVDRR